MTWGESPVFPGVAVESALAKLRAIRQDDIEFLYCSQVDVLGPGWRHRGTTPSPAAFEAGLWSGSAVQLLAVEPKSGRTIGWFNAYNYEPMDQVVSVAVARLSERQVGRAFLAGLMLFLDYVFRVLSVRKVYFEIAEYNLGALESFVDNPLRREAVLTERLLAVGRTWNLHMLSLTRQQLYEFKPFTRLCQSSAPNEGF